MFGLRKFAGKIIHFMGYGIYNLKIKEKAAEIEQLKRWTWLTKHHVDLIFDVGANKGQFVEKIRSLFPNSRIVAFEPIPDNCKIMQNKFDHDSQIFCENVALSNYQGKAPFHLNQSNPSSSFLEMNKLHKTIFPHTADSEIIDVQVDILDNYENYISSGDTILIKMDVQGTESRVIKGGNRIFDCADIVITELSFYPLYRDQAIFDHVHQLLRDHNFFFAGFLDQFTDDHHRPIFADAVYLSESVWNRFHDSDDQQKK